ncbi:aspartyl-phosphate phosphatase Spo0E family protein [Peribacillus simplex]
MIPATDNEALIITTRVFHKNRKVVESMILRKVLALRKNIGEYRQEMFKLAGKKGLSDPQVIKISQQLDGEIVMWQKIIQEIHPLAK